MSLPNTFDLYFFAIININTCRMNCKSTQSKHQCIFAQISDECFSHCFWIIFAIEKLGFYVFFAWLLFKLQVCTSYLKNYEIQRYSTWPPKRSFEVHTIKGSSFLFGQNAKGTYRVLGLINSWAIMIWGF